MSWTALARSQHGVISTAQFAGCGLSADHITSLLRRGIIERQVRGVYRATPAVHSYDAELWVAVLATGGVLMAPAACYLWDLQNRLALPTLPGTGSAIRVSIGHGRRVTAVRGVTLVRRGVADLDRRFGLAVTGLRETLIDQIALGPLGPATILADRACQLGLVTLADLDRRLRTRAHGNPTLRRVARTVGNGAESESERRLLGLLRRAGITGWQANLRVRHEGRIVARVDVGFERHRLALEVDGLQYHSDSDRFQRDRTRQNLLISLGWTVLRFTWADITARPDEVIATIRAAL